MEQQERAFNVLCVTTYYENLPPLWHREETGVGKIKPICTQIGGINFYHTTVEFNGKNYGFKSARPGLDGSCIAIIIYDDCIIKALYTDIPAKEGITSEKIKEIARHTIKSVSPWW